MFYKTSLNTDFWKVHRFYGFSKNIYIAISLSILVLCGFKYCFSWGNRNFCGKLIFLQKQDFPILNKIHTYNIVTSSVVPQFKDKSL